MDNICPKCGKIFIHKPRVYDNGDKLFIHKEKRINRPFPHYLILESCLVKSTKKES